MTYSVPEGNVDLKYAKKGGVYVPNKSGVTTWFSGDICSVRLTGQQTGGQIGLVEATVPERVDERLLGLLARYDTGLPPQ
jgi:hypothetical protein